jgi:hypothetical protein
MPSTERFSQDELDQQLALLATYRRTLAHLLEQAAQHGGPASAPPQVGNGIHEAREQIRRIKAALRARDAPTADHPDDEPPPRSPTPPADRPPDAQPAATRRDVGAGGGDYAEGNIDKRQGAFVSGGTIHGPVVGSNMGTIIASYGGPAPAGAAHGLLEQALAQVRQAVSGARQRGDDDLAEDLEGVARPLQAALKAQREGKADRRGAKLREARAVLREIAGGRPELDELVRLLDRAA